jgi:mannose-binding lectin 1
MFFAKVPLSYFASAALFACAEASYLNNDLSFGHNGKFVVYLAAVLNLC